MNNYKLTAYFKADDEEIKKMTIQRIGEFLSKILGDGVLFAAVVQKNVEEVSDSSSEELPF